MGSENPYESPQVEVTAQPEIWLKKLPAIVGVGATTSFWSLVFHSVFYIVMSLAALFDTGYEANGFYRLLEGLSFWVIPVPTLLGFLLLFQVPESTRARGYFKATLILSAVNWTWDIAVFNEKNPNDIPELVMLFFQLLRTASGLTIYIGCLRLSQFCEDPQMLRWSKLALFFGICLSLLLTLHDGLSLSAPLLFGELIDVEKVRDTRLYELFIYAQWAAWLPLIYLHGRTLWRIPAHAEVEAMPKIDTTSPHSLPSKTNELESL